MNRAGADPFQRVLMKTRPVAFMTRESVPGVGRIRVRFHPCVAGRFRQNRSGGDRKRIAVAMRRVQLAAARRFELYIIDQQRVGMNRQPGNSADHCQFRGVQDAEPVNFARRCEGDRARRAAAPDQVRQFGALSGCQRFTVADVGKEARFRFRREYNRGGANRSGPRAAAGFVDSRNIKKAFVL